VSQPALQFRIARVQPVRTPIPATRPTVDDGRRRELAEADARVDLGFALLARDAVHLHGPDPSFAARARALLLDIDSQAELLRTLASTTPAVLAELYARGPLAAERRLAVRRWLRQAGEYVA
jgi:hypothetical protein